MKRFVFMYQVKRAFKVKARKAEGREKPKCRLPSIRRINERLLYYYRCIDSVEFNL